jgi:hypothetical protein
MLSLQVRQCPKRGLLHVHMLALCNFRRRILKNVGSSTDTSCGPQVKSICIYDAHNDQKVPPYRGTSEVLPTFGTVLYFCRTAACQGLGTDLGQGKLQTATVTLGTQSIPPGHLPTEVLPTSVRTVLYFLVSIVLPQPARGWVPTVQDLGLDSCMSLEARHTARTLVQSTKKRYLRST